MKKEIQKNKFPLQLDLAYSVIYWSIALAILCFGVTAILEVTRFNVIALIFFVITLILVYFGTGFNAVFKDHSLVCSYFRGLRKEVIDLNEVKQVVLTNHEQKWFFINEAPPASISVEEHFEDQMISELRKNFPHIEIEDNRIRIEHSSKKSKDSFIMNILK